MTIEPQKEPSTESGAKSGDRKRPWVEPEVRVLEVTETAILPTRGLDGQARFVDCTRS